MTRNIPRVNLMLATMPKYFRDFNGFLCDDGCRGGRNVRVCSLSAPEGFKPLPPSEGNTFLGTVADLWARLEGNTAVLGFRVEDRHANPLGTCHGGMLLTFADNYLPTVVRLQEGMEDGLTPTVSITADFLAPARQGQWIEGRGRLLQRTGNLLFVDGLVSADGAPVLRVSAIFRRGKPGDRARRLAELQKLLGGPAAP